MDLMDILSEGSPGSDNMSVLNGFLSEGNPDSGFLAKAPLLNKVPRFLPINSLFSQCNIPAISM